MNILLINHYAGSPRHGMEYRPYYLAREWVRLGHRVQIIASSQSHVRSQQPQLLRLDSLDETIDGIQYIWFKTLPYAGNNIGRVCNMASFISRLYREGSFLAESFNPDVVIASSTYPMDIWPAHRIAKMAKAKLIFEVHDLWPLSPMELGGMSKLHPFIMVVQAAENYAYRHADQIISLLPKADSYMQQHGMAQEKFVCIPNGIDVSEWVSFNHTLPEEHQTLLDQLHKDNRFILGYAGGHAISNALKGLIQSSTMMEDIPVDLILVGNGVEKANLQRLAEKLGCRNIYFLPPVKKVSIPALLAKMDAVYIGSQRKSVYRFGISPNKLLDYMMAAKPVIQAIEAGNDIVAESGCGVSIPPEDPEAISRAVRQLMALGKDTQRAMGLRGRGYVIANHNYMVLARRFLESL